MEVLAGVEAGDEIVPRLLSVYRAAAEGWPPDYDEYDAYFNVFDPSPITASYAVELVLGHLLNVKLMAQIRGLDGPVAVLEPLPRVEIIQRVEPWGQGQEDLEFIIHTAIKSYMGALSPRESPILALEEAFQSFADVNLRHFVLWPLYRDASTIEEPFQPFFDLWRHGVEFHFGNDGDVRVHVPRLVEPA
ncbi:hypothetical protein [Paludisphaera rhizosphaerae]|uniref:hypothetical protein n=1 Tax=Paludisphaera rhizosphaerae TaxID=2711216 RepID=UPI0013ECED40|nr:hypothetical protein [Paludisphaera rhizosphaerae]